MIRTFLILISLASIITHFVIVSLLTSPKFGDSGIVTIQFNCTTSSISGQMLNLLNSTGVPNSLSLGLQRACVGYTDGRLDCNSLESAPNRIAETAQLYGLHNPSTIFQTTPAIKFQLTLIVDLVFVGFLFVFCCAAQWLRTLRLCFKTIIIFSMVVLLVPIVTTSTVFYVIKSKALGLGYLVKPGDAEIYGATGVATAVLLLSCFAGLMM